MCCAVLLAACSVLNIIPIERFQSECSVQIECIASQSTPPRRRLDYPRTLRVCNRSPSRCPAGRLRARVAAAPSRGFLASSAGARLLRPPLRTAALPSLQLRNYNRPPQKAPQAIRPPQVRLPATITSRSHQRPLRLRRITRRSRSRPPESPGRASRRISAPTATSSQLQTTRAAH